MCQNSFQSYQMTNIFAQVGELVTNFDVLLTHPFSPNLLKNELLTNYGLITFIIIRLLYKYSVCLQIRLIFSSCVDIIVNMDSLLTLLRTEKASEILGDLQLDAKEV